MDDLAVWYAIPSANPSRAQTCLAKWKAQGYKTAVMLDAGQPTIAADWCNHIDPYPGYFSTVNQMCRILFEAGADIVVTGGDDMYPDQKQNAQVLGRLFFKEFPDGYGVMQPVGDIGIPGTDKICGSPWIGKAFWERTYGGEGPFWHGYNSYYGDEEMFNVAKQLECLFQPKQVTQYHDHFSRPGGLPKQSYQQRNERYWKQDQQLFFQRKAAGFPQAMPKEVS
jgi:hypothetical protein